MASVRAYLEAEKSSSTRRAYASDFSAFTSWCERAAETPLPASPVAVARYLAQLADAGLKAATIVRRAAAIRYAHKAASLDPPTAAEGVKAVLRGIRRRIGTRQVRKAPATDVVLAHSLDQLTDSLAGLRDRALLLVGFAGALRRSELVGLEVDDADIHAKGMVLQIRRSKTDQEGRGHAVKIPRGKGLRPVDALETWLAAAQIHEGPIFREVDRHGNVGAGALSDRSVARIVQRTMTAAGLDARIYAGHSLRAGFVTTALGKGVDPLKVMKQTRHTDPKTLAIYDRRENEFDDNAGTEFL